MVAASRVATFEESASNLSRLDSALCIFLIVLPPPQSGGRGTARRAQRRARGGGGKPPGRAMRRTLITNRARAMRKAIADGVLLYAQALIDAEGSRLGLAPSTIGSSPGPGPGSADGPPPAAARGR